MPLPEKRPLTSLASLPSRNRVSRDSTRRPPRKRRPTAGVEPRVIGSYARLIAALSWVPLRDARGLLGRCWLMGCACSSLFLGSWGLPRTVDGTAAFRWPYRTSSVFLRETAVCMLDEYRSPFLPDNQACATLTTLTFTGTFLTSSSEKCRV